MAWKWLLVFGLGVSSQVLAVGLSLDKVLNLALQKSPEISIIEQQRLAGTYQAKTFLAEALPVLSFRLNYDNAEIPSPDFTTNDVIAGTNSQWRLDFKTPIFTFGRVGGAWNLYDIEDKRIIVRDQKAKDDFLKRVIASYALALREVRFRDSAEKALQRTTSLRQFSFIESNSGAVSQIESIRTEAAYQQAQANFEKAKANAIAELNRLKVVLGVDLRYPLDLDISLGIKGAYFTLPKKQPKESLQLVEKRLTNEFDQTSSKIEGAKYYPSISLTASLSGSAIDGTGNPVFDRGDLASTFEKRNRSMTYGLEFEWNLYSGGRDYAGHQSAKARAAQSKIEFNRSIQEEKIAKIQTKINVTANKKIFQASLKSLEANRLLLDRANDEFKEGAVSIIQLLEFEEDLSAAEAQAIESYNNYITAIADLKITQGWGIR